MGVGGGLTLTIGNISIEGFVPSVAMLQKNFDGNFDMTTEIIGKISITSIGTYYDGGMCNVEDIPVTIRISDITDVEDFDDDDLDCALYEFLNSITDRDIHYGGGWGHTTFKGDIEADATSAFEEAKILLQITDENIIKKLDAFAHGENRTQCFSVYEDGDAIEGFVEKSKAIAYAESIADDEAHIEVIREIFVEDFDGDIYDVETYETVWEN